MRDDKQRENVQGSGDQGVKAAQQPQHAESSQVGGRVRIDAGAESAAERQAVVNVDGRIGLWCVRLFREGVMCMDPSVLKVAILRLIAEHEKTNAGTFLDDKVIASRLGAELELVQRQLLILESRSLVMLAKTFGPSYAALLTPSGMEALEAMNTVQTLAPKRAIGF